MSQQLDQLFADLARTDQYVMPTLLREIENGHPWTNAKERLREMHTVVATLLRYVVLADAEKRNATLGQLGQLATSASHDNMAPALLPTNHYPASGQVALGTPEAVARPVINTLIDGSLPIPSTPINVMAGGGGLVETDPEPADVVQIITRKDGTTKVIPPRGSNVPPRVFGLGQHVDATFYLMATPGVTSAPGA
jgi:hypothetical protein